MVRLNKTKLTEEQLNALFVQLSTTIGKLSKHEAEYFLSELLGTEERIMLAKRLAIIILLREGKTLYSISHILKVSATTAEKIKQGLDNGKYTHLVSSLQKRKRDYVAILDTLDSILHLGGVLPHRYGLERYRSLNKLLRETEVIKRPY